MRVIFKRSKDFVEVFSSQKHYCFDECNFAWDELTHTGKSIFEVKTAIESFTHVIKMAETKKEITAHFDFILLEGLIGKIFFKNTYEGILYHMFCV